LEGNDSSDLIPMESTGNYPSQNGMIWDCQEKIPTRATGCQKPTLP